MIFLARNRGAFGDAVDDALADDPSSTDSLIAPSTSAYTDTLSTTSSGSTAGAAATTSPPAQDSGWTSVFQSVIKGVFTPGASRPSSLIRPSTPGSSSSTTTVVLVVGGLVVFGGLAFLLSRGRSG